MKHKEQIKTFAFVTSLLFAFSGSVSAELIDFEDIIISPDSGLPYGNYQSAIVPSVYHDIDWSGGYGINSWAVSSASSDWFPSVQPPSGQNYAWSSGATDLSISGTKFDFISMWASSGFFGNTGEAIARGYINGIQIFTQSFTPTNTRFQLFTFNFTGIDYLTFTDQHGNLLIDNINLNITSVPVPTSAWFFGSGLIGLTGLSRKRKAL